MSSYVSNLQRALDWLSEQGSNMLCDIAELSQQNSFTENREGGQAVNEILKHLFAIEGLVCTEEVSQSFANHLVFSNANNQPEIGLVGHFDTVFPPGVFERFQRDRDIAKGPGVLDMKGGLVVVAYALRALSQEGLLNQKKLKVVIVSDEEVGSPEGQWIIKKHLQNATYALVFEAGRAHDEIITQRKGTGSIHAIFSGKAAHAGNAYTEGVNAIWALSKFVDRVQKLTRLQDGITVNVGQIKGGTTKNTVPDFAEAHIDFRFQSIQQGQELLLAFEEAAKGVSLEIEGSGYKLEGKIGRPPLERTEANIKLARLYGACAQQEGLGSTEAGLVGGGSDANTTSAMGIASIDGLGPRGKGFHTINEYIEIASLVPKAKTLIRWLTTNLV